MNRIGNQLLAGSALSSDKYGYIRPCKALDVTQHLLHGFAVSENSRCGRAIHRGGKPAILLLQLVNSRRTADDELQYLGICWFLKEIVCPRSHRHTPGFTTLIAGDDDDLGFRRYL